MRKTTKLLGAIFGILWALPVWGADCITDSDNIFLSDGATVGFYSQDGSYTDQHANMMTTDFLNIPDSAVTLKYSFDGEVMSAPCIVFFDNAQQPIYFYPMGGQNTVSITIPDETKYVKIPYRTTFTTQTVTYTYDRCLGMPIKIATTKYNETAFGPLNTALQNAISVVDTVVSNTITQAASIATLQAQKQTRPNDIADDNEKCPAGKKCLLVEDASGIPHWYEIVENAYVLPSGYTQLQYIDGGEGSYINTGKHFKSSYTYEFSYKTQATSNTAILGVAGGRDGSSAYSWDFLVNNEGFYYPYSTTSSVRITISNVDRTIWHTYKFNGTNAVAIFDDTNVWKDTLLTSDWESSKNIYLFNSNRNGIATGSATLSIKYFVVEDENGILIQNLVPAQRNSDGVIGMVDTVSGEFFTNAGTGEFIAGPVAE